MKPGPLCSQCPLKDTAGPVWGNGSPRATLVGIGMAPAHNEITFGYPFAGVSGDVYNRNLYQAGYMRDQVYTTNVVKCLVEPGKPLPTEAVRCCAPLLRQELDLLDKPNLTILTMGQEAFHAFTHKKLHIQSPMWRRESKKAPDPQAWLRGCVYTISKLARQAIIPTMHPAYLARTGFKDAPFFQRDIQKAVRFSKGLGTWYDETYNYKPTSREVQEYVERILKAGHFGCDIETPEKPDDEEEGSVATGKSTIEVIGISAGIGECIGVAPDQFALLRTLFSDRSRPYVRCYAFNWGFDGWHLSTHFDLGGVQAFDVMKAFILTYSDSTRKDLGTALSWWTDMPYTKNLRLTQPDRYNATDTYGALWAGINAEKELRLL